MEDNEKTKLEARVQIAGLYRAMCQTEGFKDLKREMDARVTDLRNAWLKADDAEALRIKSRAQVYEEVFNIIKAKILVGDQAARVLQGEAEQNLQ